MRRPGIRRKAKKPKAPSTATAATLTPVPTPIDTAVLVPEFWFGGGRIRKLDEILGVTDRLGVLEILAVGVLVEVEDGIVKGLIEGEYVEVTLEEALDEDVIDGVYDGVEEVEGVIVTVFELLGDDVNEVVVVAVLEFDVETLDVMLAVADDVGVFD